jgi:nitrite reductase/ring-hydroxylating ferredoxin subunit
LVLARVEGELHALADRCTHRGGPLHEGELHGDCVTCPWHESRFSMRDGSVLDGPAVRPQPAFDVRTEGGKVQARRDDSELSLRHTPVGA